MYVIRGAQPEDVPAIATLMEQYMRETYRGGWHGSTRALTRDAFGAEFRVLVVERRQLVALLAWQTSYDLHHCIAGGQVLDLFVLPETGLGATTTFWVAERSATWGVWRVCQRVS